MRPERRGAVRCSLDAARIERYVAAMKRMDSGVAAESPGEPDATAMRVLASGSAGNCTVIAIRAGGQRRILLVDLGLSPSRTRRLLNQCGLDLDQVDRVFLTHLDGDHYQPAWSRALPRRATLHVHRRHARLAVRRGAPPDRIAPIDSSVEIDADVAVSAAMLEHDKTGVCAFRIRTPRGTIGYATDLGRPSDSLADHLLGVDALAIESNYCPQQQSASNRPAFVKRRIMGGAGHLSNQQSAQMVQRIKPREHLVLLHLSRRCNTPALAAQAQQGAGCEMTISDQHRMTPWIRLSAEARGADCPFGRRASFAASDASFCSAFGFE